MTSLNDRVRHLIGASGLSQGQFAEAVGLDAPKLSKSLSGVRRFSSLDLARIAEHAGRTVDWLLTGEEPPWPSRLGPPQEVRRRRPRRRRTSWSLSVPASPHSGSPSRGSPHRFRRLGGRT